LGKNIQTVVGLHRACHGLDDETRPLFDTDVPGARRCLAGAKYLRRGRLVGIIAAGNSAMMMPILDNHPPYLLTIHFPATQEGWHGRDCNDDLRYRKTRQAASALGQDNIGVHCLG
ncbi:unnamed protein product, partial [Ectocarpus fasciculatus]